MRYDEYEVQQHTALETTLTFIKETWIPNLKNDIKSSLKDVGKGWFNLKETNRQVYDFSKMKRFLAMVNITMEDFLRFMTETSIRKYEATLTRAAGGLVVNVQSTHIVHQTLAPGYEHDEDILTAPPLFSIELTIKEHEPEYSIPPANFTQLCLHVLENGISSLSVIQQLEHQIMTEMFWPSKNCLRYVSRDEPRVKVSIEKLKTVLESAVRPVEKYRELYLNYKEFCVLNVKDMVTRMEADPNTTLDEIAKLISRHRREQALVETNVPAMPIKIGLFCLTCTQVLEKLLQKHSLVISELQKLIVRLVALRADSICGKYKEIMEQIQIKPKDIEGLAAMREYMASIPEMTVVLEKKIEDARRFYEVLDESCFQLENDDFGRRMDVTVWPSKLKKALIAIAAQNAKEEEIFIDSLHGFQGRFVDDVQELSVEIDNFCMITDFTRVKEQARTAISYTKKLKDFEENVRKINSREILFGVQLTEYPQVTAKIKKFTPYGDLWKTAASWIEWHDEWMNGPLNLIDFEVNIHVGGTLIANKRLVPTKHSCWSEV